MGGGVAEFCDDELVDVLVGHDEVEAIFSRFGEDRGERVGGEVLELIDIKEEVAALVFGDVGAAHRGHLDFGDDDETEKLGVQIPYRTFGKAHEEDFSLIHYFAEVEGGVFLADGVTHDRIRNEGAEFGAEVWDHFLAFTVAGIGVFVLPEGFDDGVFDFFDFVFEEGVVGKDSRYIDEGRAFFLVFH